MSAPAAPGRDRDRGYLAHRAVQVIGGGGLAFGAALFLPPAEVGFFFLLLSLLGAQALLDAGSSTVLVSFVGRTMRHLHWSAQGRPVGSVAARARLGDLTRLAIAWAAASAVVALAFMLPLAWFLLNLAPETAQIDSARAITTATIAALALYQLGAALPLVLEGGGRISEVAQVRAVIDLIAYMAAATCLLTGHGLWAPAVLWGLRAAGNLAWSVPKARQLLGSPQRGRLRWRLAAMAAPMQRRLALSWVAGYLAHQSLIPISFVLLGPVVTGQIGLGLFLVNGVLMVATASAAARAPALSSLGAARRWAEFDSLSTNALVRGLGVAVLGHGLVLASVAAATVISATAAGRLPAFSWLSMLIMSSLASTAIHAIATSLRACGREPFLAPTLVGAALLPPALVAGAHGAGGTGLCLAYLLLNAGLGLPWAAWLKRRFEASRLKAA